MQTALCFIRTALALWVCVGAQLHLSLDHASYWEHAAEGHGPSAHAHAHEDDAPRPVTLHCACGSVESEHRHHGHHVLHDHDVDAVAVKTTYRAFHLIAGAILPVPPAEVSCPATAPVPDANLSTYAPLYLSCEFAPRAPPVA